MAEVEISSENVKQMLAILHKKFGTDPEYPGFKPDNIEGISYSFSEGSGNVNYRKKEFDIAARSGNNKFIARAKSNLNAAAKPRPLINITLTLTNGKKVLFQCNNLPKYYLNVSNDHKRYTCVYTDADKSVWKYIFARPYEHLELVAKMGICQIVGQFIDTGRIEFPIYGGSRKRKTANNRRKRQTNTRKARR
jgi:hypothetical protein